jgi:hypothetical protein
MIASSDPNGDDVPKSTTKPVFFCVVFQIIVVPVFTQKVLFPFALGILGVADAPTLLRFTSTVQGLELDPQVLPELQSD